MEFFSRSGEVTSIVKNYKLVTNKIIWRAKPEVNNGIPYVQLGIVVSPYGLVDRWRDFCSIGSVMRKINV